MDFRYIKRFFAETSDSYFLFGPRGTGKSTMTKNNHPDALFFDLRLPETRYKLLANPDFLKEVVLAQPSGKTIVIDEIQKIPQLLSIVHFLIEKKQNWQFILTGSSARKLKRKGVDLLGGRALKKIMHPFMAAELQHLFDFEDVLLYGLLPLRFGKNEAQETLKAYISLYLEEEVKAEGLARNYDLFARFLQVMAFSHGSILNVSNISRECFVKRTTVSEWISILEDLLIAYELTIFTRKAKKELSAHPKFYFFDVGVYRTLRYMSLKDNEKEIEGIALEGLILQHLVAWRDYTKSRHEINFWRTRSGTEVDFIVHGELGFWAIEVKNSTTIRPDDVRGLSAFAEDYPEAKLILIYRGKERMLKKNILCIPAQEFLLSLLPNKEII